MAQEIILTNSEEPDWVMRHLIRRDWREACNSLVEIEAIGSVIASPP